MNEKVVRTIIAEEMASPPTLVIYAAGIHSNDSGFPGAIPGIVVAAWEDGTVVWSADKLKGGSPYFKSIVDSEELATAITSMCEAKANLPANTHTDYRGPSSPETTILLGSESCNIYWHSWHEIWEATGRHVALERGIYPLPPGETVENMRANYSSPHHIAFIEAWKDVKEAALRLIPEDTSEVEEVELTLRYHWTTMVIDP